MTIHKMQFPTTRQEVEGGYLITGVPLLVAGVWNGITYTPEELRLSANNWRDNSVYNRHYEGMQRDESNRIGHIRNQRYENEAILGDVFLSNESDNGKEMIHYVKTNQINGMSVEHVGAYAEVDSKVIAYDISFWGAAVVPTPACTVCQLSMEELNMKQEDFDKLSDTVAELAKGVTELTKVDVESIVKAQSEKDGKIITELSARIKKLENIPDPGTPAAVGIEDSYADIVVEHGNTYGSDK